jgi:hypothetical protein
MEWAWPIFRTCTQGPPDRLTYFWSRPKRGVAKSGRGQKWAWPIWGSGRGLFPMTTLGPPDGIFAVVKRGVAYSGRVLKGAWPMWLTTQGLKCTSVVFGLGSGRGLKAGVVYAGATTLGPLRRVDLLSSFVIDDVNEDDSSAWHPI